MGLPFMLHQNFVEVPLIPRKQISGV